MDNLKLYAEPRQVTSLQDCFFYTMMDIPGHGVVYGDWDLRDGAQRYLGHVSFQGKKVLDVGTANGFLTFHMEKQGAEVISYDISDDNLVDIVPFAGVDYAAKQAGIRAAIRKMNNGYWLCHRAYGSRARMVHGTVYGIPPAIGPVDISVFGSILLHLRDPFLALQNALQLTRETAIVTDVIPRRNLWQVLFHRWFRPRMTFMPEFRTHRYHDNWWTFTPLTIKHMIGVLGFEDARVSYHWQTWCGKKRPLFTVVGQRTKPPAILPASAAGSHTLPLAS